MDCQHQMTQYALLSMSDVDMNDVRFGQLLTLLVGLSIVVLVRGIHLLCQ
jgi:hypothetical protein